jgi:hypothetical protein
VLLPYVLLKAFKTKERPRVGVIEQPNQDIDEVTRKGLQELFVLLACATNLIFVRINYVSTADTIQAYLQSYCKLFAKSLNEEFADDVVLSSLWILFSNYHTHIIPCVKPQVPNHHFAMHFKGKIRDQIL